MIAFCSFFRSYSGLPDLLYHLTFITQTRYTGAIFNEIEYYNKTSLVSLKWINETTQQTYKCEGNTFGFGCRYLLFNLTLYGRPLTKTQCYMTSIKGSRPSVFI